MSFLGTGREGRARTIAFLLATASAAGLMTATAARAEEAALAAAADAAAPAAAPASATVQEIVVTGSHIRGVQAVGQPVTTLSDKEFKQTGAVTIGDLLETVPQITMIADFNVINGGGYVARDQNINIRNLSQKGTRTLMMIDGMRFPNQGNGGCQTDPSIIPQLAVDRVDVLANGASAEYGSDAVAGVVNVVLKRRYEGMTTQVSYNQSQDIGGARGTISGPVRQEMGTAERQERRLHGQLRSLSDRPYQRRRPAQAIHRQLFELWPRQPDAVRQFAAGDRVRGQSHRRSRRPGELLAVGPQLRQLLLCAQGPERQGPDLGADPRQSRGKNEYNNFYDGWISPSQTRVGLTAAFDQEITPNVEFFADAWFNDRKTTMHSTSQGLSNYALPTSYNNPYTPLGAPNNLVLNFDLTTENPIMVTTKELATRLDGGFNFNLPKAWKAKFIYALSDIHEYNDSYGGPTKNNVIAALGGKTTAVAATATTPAIPSFTKPSGIPYLDPFCDARPSPTASRRRPWPISLATTTRTKKRR